LESGRWIKKLHATKVERPIGGAEGTARGGAGVNGKLLIWIVTCKPQSKMQGSMTESTASTATSKSRMSPQPDVETSISPQDSPTEEFIDKLSDDSKGLGADGDTSSMSDSYDTTLSSSDENFERIEHTYDGLITAIQSYVDGFELNVIVSSALSPTYVYTNSYEDSFKSGTPLKFSSRWDTVQACCVADIDMDGRAEIILGTFGQALLVYKYMDEILPQWVIVSKKQFSRGILGIEFINNYLHVVTALGIHILEYNTAAYFTNKPSVTSDSFELGH
ncbi:Kaptin, partial [Orchesella cincta]